MEVIKVQDKNIKILLTIPENMRDALKEKADKKELPLSSFIRMVLKEYLEEEVSKN